ncbi:redoxin family protein [Rhodanobacter sp. L36]|uniref:redoxin family protein n=1 Tax=Rhodanobacter sp. L36 TaxID=1747221 RepID=UPI0015759A2F|nr:redoxin family protein [Rhodanobacter sp. L36]
MKSYLRVFLFSLLIASGTSTAQSAISAPEFTGINHWINSPPLTMASLRGKVVLVDFWAYSCINCLRAMPRTEHLYETYKNKGLVVIGVHSPEFDFEGQSANVENAVKRLDVTYPVALDNDLGTWNAWHNQYWPAEYLIDQNGNLIGHQFGEGNYLRMENAVRLLLGMNLLQKNISSDDALDKISSPEMFFGSMHQKNLAGVDKPRNGIQHFTMPSHLALNQFGLSGAWEISNQYAGLSGSHGEIHLRFKAGKLHMVASSDQPVTLDIQIDGKPQPHVSVQASQLYTLFDSNDYREHSLVLRIPQHGLHVYTFTFG